jgi:hypothetical protein
MRSRVTRRTAVVEPALRPANIVGGRRHAHPIRGLAPQQIPALPSDPWRDCTRHQSAEAKARSAPPVGGLGGSHQGRAQLPQFRRARTFVQCGSDVFRCASHLVDTVGEVSGLHPGQHHRVGGQRPTLGTVDRGPLLVGTLPARLPAVLTATTHPAVGDVAATPTAWLRADAACHGADFSRGPVRIPVSWDVGSPGCPGTRSSVASLFRAQAA